MTRLPGSTELLPPDVGALHDVLAAIHAAPPGELARFHPYRGYHQGHAWPRPAWWHDPATWERMTARRRGRPTA